MFELLLHCVKLTGQQGCTRVVPLADGSSLSGRDGDQQLRRWLMWDWKRVLDREWSIFGERKFLGHPRSVGRSAERSGLLYGRRRIPAGCPWGYEAVPDWGHRLQFRNISARGLFICAFPKIQPPEVTMYTQIAPCSLS